MLEYMTPEESVRLKSFNAFYSNPSTLQNVPVPLQPGDGAAAHVVLPPTPVPIFSSSGTPGATPTGGVATAVCVDEDSLECPICMEAKPEVVLTCTHGFCNRCLKQWFERNESSNVASLMTILLGRISLPSALSAGSSVVAMMDSSSPTIRPTLRDTSSSSSRLSRGNTHRSRRNHQHGNDRKSS
jgi:hypothetical protein